MILSKAFAGITVGLLIVCGLLYWSHGRATEANASLRAEIAVQESVLAAHEEALSRMIEEKERLEKTMAQRLAEQMRIQRQTEAELRETATRLAQLRDEHEDIQKFLALPVPRSFVDHWMRGTPEDHSSNED